MTNTESKVRVVKKDGFLQLETESGIYLSRQCDLTIKSEVDNRKYITVSVDFKIPIEEFKIHQGEETQECSIIKILNK